jgi:hypothetical protein
MEPEGSLLSLQEPATRSYPEPAESIPHSHTLFKILFNIILPSIPSSSMWLCSFQVFPLKLCVHFLSTHAYYLSHPSLSA